MIRFRGYLGVLRGFGGAFGGSKVVKRGSV